MFAPGKPLQPDLLFVGKAKSLPQSGIPRKCFDPASPALQTLVTYGRKKFYAIVPWFYSIANCTIQLNIRFVIFFQSEN